MASSTYICLSLRPGDSLSENYKRELLSDLALLDKWHQEPFLPPSLTASSPITARIAAAADVADFFEPHQPALEAAQQTLHHRVIGAAGRNWNKKRTYQKIFFWIKVLSLMRKSEPPPGVFVAPLEKVSKGLVVCLSVSVCIFAIFLGLWASWNAQYTRSLCFVESLCGENGTTFFWNVRISILRVVASSGSFVIGKQHATVSGPAERNQSNLWSGGCKDRFAGRVPNGHGVSRDLDHVCGNQLFTPSVAGVLFGVVSCDSQG